MNAHYRKPAALGMAIVAIYVAIASSAARLYWVEFALMVGAVVGIGVVVARA